MNTYRPENPLIVQGDHTILVEVDSPRYAEARDELVCFAELVKAPEHTNAFWMWSDFSEYYAANNAFADRLKKRSNVTGDLGGCYYYQMKAEDIEELWPRFLDRILAGRLFPARGRQGRTRGP